VIGQVLLRDAVAIHDVKLARESLESQVSSHRQSAVVEEPVAVRTKAEQILKAVRPIVRRT